MEDARPVASLQSQRTLFGIILSRSQFLSWDEENAIVDLLSTDKKLENEKLQSCENQPL